MLCLVLSVEEVCETLQGAGLREVKSITDLKDLTYSRDAFCPDTLVFPQQLHALVQHCSLTATHVLNMQVDILCSEASNSTKNSKIPNDKHSLVQGGCAELLKDMNKTE